MNFESVLILANKPAGASSVLYWRPFGKSTVNELVEKHNENHKAAMECLGWPENQIQELSQFMRLENYDLAEIGKINLSIFSQIKFVFASLSDIAAAPAAVEIFKASINQGRQKYYLAQLSKPLKPSQRYRFIPSPYLVSRPEVIDDEEKLEQWLAEVDGYAAAASTAIQFPPDAGGGSSDPGGRGGGPGGGSEGGPGGGSGGGRIDKGDPHSGASGDPDADDYDVQNFQPSSWTNVYLDYLWTESSLSQPLATISLGRSRAEIAAEVRDTAYERELSTEDTQALARKAVLQEEFLGYVHRSVKHHLGLDPVRTLVLDNLRKPLKDISVEDEYAPSTDTLELVSVRLKEPVKMLSSKDQKIFRDFGITDEDSAALLVTRPQTLKKLEGFKSKIETESVSVDIPFDATTLLR